MIDPDLYVTVATAGLAGLAMVTMATLSGWRGWLRWKHEALNHYAHDAHAPTAMVQAGPSAGTRIELADLKERIRRLEAIAAGVDL